MAAVLTTTGLQFSDSTTLDSKYGIFPQSSRVIFFQASAPTGWSQVAANNNRALRVVSGAAGGTGGNSAFTTIMATTRSFSANCPVTINGLSGGPTTLSANQIPAHSHPASTNSTANSANTSNGGTARVDEGLTNTGSIGNGGGHSHPLTANAANGPVSSSLNFAVQYIDVIYCSFS